jgi:hypothetical protein
MRAVRQATQHSWRYDLRIASLIAPSWLDGILTHLSSGLSVHMNQVHKETLQCVENALPNRSGLDVEIFGMEGVPEDILQQHNQRIIQNFYQAQAERQKATGNPPRGHSGGQGPTKKIKYETPEEIKKRLAEHRAKLAAQKAAAANGVPPPAAPTDGQAPAPVVSRSLTFFYSSSNAHPQSQPGARIPTPTTRLSLPSRRRSACSSRSRSSRCPACPTVRCRSGLSRRCFPTGSVPAAACDSTIPPPCQATQWRCWRAAILLRGWRASCGLPWDGTACRAYAELDRCWR